MIDYENLQNLARQLPASVAVLTFAEGGDAAIKVVYRACKQLFTAIDPSQLGGACARLLSGRTALHGIPTFW